MTNSRPLPFIVTADGLQDVSSLIRLWESDPFLWRFKLFEFGAILFRGFGIKGAEELGRAAKIIVSRPLDYRGGDAPRTRLSSVVYNSTELPPDRDLSAHNEKAYSAQHPDIVLFSCEIAPEVGGATPLFDGRIIWQSLSEELSSKLRSQKITFIQNLHGGIGAGKSWMATFETDSREDVSTFLDDINASYVWRQDGSLHVEENLSPFVVHPVTKVEAIFSPFDRWYRDAGEFGSGCSGVQRAVNELYHYCRFESGEPVEAWMVEELRSHIRESRKEFPWSKGDLLVVDNRLVMHGRAPFSGARRILVAMGMDSGRMSAA